MRPLIVMVCVLLPLVAQAGTQHSVVLSIPTMDCATCPILIRKALERVDGVVSARVSYDRREAVVTFDASKADIAKLVRATTNVGYPSFERD